MSSLAKKARRGKHVVKAGKQVVKELPLNQLITTAREEHVLAINAATEAIEHAIKAGRALLAMEGYVKRGETRWGLIYKDCNLGERQAQRYKLLAKRVEANPTCKSDLKGLSIEEAIKKLPSPVKMAAARLKPNHQKNREMLHRMPLVLVVPRILLAPPRILKSLMFGYVRRPPSGRLPSNQWGKPAGGAPSPRVGSLEYFKGYCRRRLHLKYRLRTPRLRTLSATAKLKATSHPPHHP